MDDYVQAVNRELALLGKSTHGNALPVHTVYFGGGTPSLLGPAHFAALLETAHREFSLTADVEITVEANPSTVDLPYFQALKTLGINRLSLGMQSAQQRELTLFARLHHHHDVENAVENARRAGFDNLSLDLIYGVPLQTRAMWNESLRAALDLSPDHLSLYALGLEAGTEMMRAVQSGKLPLPDPDLAADMYDDATEALAAAGFVQYEISNWSLPGKSCRHNLQYWRNLPYLGIGAGAHGYAAGCRTVNAMKPELYIERITNAETKPFPQTGATIKCEELTPITDRFETIFMGLRLLDEGLSLSDFARRYGTPLPEAFPAEIRRLKEWGLLREDKDRLFLTARARLLSNRVFEQFMQET